jgi:hypothetical protein
MKKIFQQSIDLFGEQVIKKEVREVRIDTTVQEKNITIPQIGSCTKSPLNTAKE